VRVTVYVPVLKGRRAELDALLHAREAVTAVIRPLLEVVPGEGRSVSGSVQDFADRLMDVAPKGMPFAVDCRYLRQAGSGHGDPLALAARDLDERAICMVPVFGPGDGVDVASVAAAVRLHKAGGCLRLHLAPGTWRGRA
jgi:hypothetical protein